MMAIYPLVCREQLATSNIYMSTGHPIIVSCGHICMTSVRELPKGKNTKKVNTFYSILFLRETFDHLGSIYITWMPLLPYMALLRVH